ncbi:MAG TPA: metalloregulator ArsR/SmtB family transcription factor [Tepidisphaeraceae bacterium]|nr:metalloregulator ArsR/SmtB family transcription factor [Tepidisphaeraceae bacterium]
MVKTGTQAANLFAWMDALGDPTRLRLLRLLEHHELTVNDLCDILQLPQSTISRHLKVLADQDWLRSRTQATTHLYRMLLDELSAPARKLWILARQQSDDWATLAQDQLRLRRRLKQRAGDSQSFFASAAGQWDALRSQLYGHGFIAAAIGAMLPSTYTVADLGCGTGSFSQILAPHVKRVLAVDHSPAMLKTASKHLADFSNVEVIRAELTSLPIEDHSCDAAVLSLVLTYIDDPAAVLGEMARILKPGGKAIIVDLLPHDRDDFRRELGQISLGFSPESLGSLLQNCSLTKINISPLPPEPDAKGPALFLAVAEQPG